MRAISFSALLMILTLPGALQAAGSAPLTQVDARAYTGKPFGVGVITLSTPYLSAEIVRDIVVHELNSRALYPVTSTSRIRLAQAPDEGTITDVSIYFLFHGDEKLNLSMRSYGKDYFIDNEVNKAAEPIHDKKAHQRLLQKWWQLFSARTRHVITSDSYYPQVENFLTGMLARRLDLTPPVIRHPWSFSHGLSRTLGILLGTESIRVAMMRKRLLKNTEKPEVADQPLPKPASPPAIEIPEPNQNLQIEPIAMRIPVECFYVRFGSFANFQWFRSTMDQWGGSIRDLVIIRGLDYRIHIRLEKQLALKESALSRMLGDIVVSDVAVIGTDTFFREGAAVGILFQAKNSAMLGMQLTARRHQTLQTDKKLSLKNVTINGQKVSLLSTPDNTTRSFYAVSGDYHLVCTSESIVRRFLATAGKTGQSLGASREFRYARSHMPITRNDKVFIYLSDPFFRGIVGPHYRVEMTRRMQAQTDIEILHLARLAAAAEGVADRDIQSLTEAGFLPPDFGRRADNSSAMEKGEQITDSLRGARGSFLPIPDVTIDAVTAAESKAYNRFASYYQRQWENMDPAIIALKHQPEKGERTEQIIVDLHVSPYAKRHYGVLLNHLGKPVKKRMAVVPGNIVSLDLTCIPSLIGINLPTRAFAGLRDFTAPFVIHKGRLIPGDLPSEKIPGYAGIWQESDAMTIANSVAKLFGSVTADKVDSGGYAKTSHNGWLRQFGSGVVFAKDKKLLGEITGSLRLEITDRANQLNLTVGELLNSKSYPALNAQAFLHARKISAGNPLFLQNLIRQLRVKPANALKVGEKILGARMVCPLGGTYKLRDSTRSKYRFPGLSATHWTSSAWKVDDLLLVDSVPAGYAFSLLTWLRGMKLGFTIDETTLSTRITLQLGAGGSKAAVDSSAPLQLPTGGVTLEVAQRTTATVPGSKERMKISIGDVTAGQTMVNLLWRDKALVSRSMKNGDGIDFKVGVTAYRLTLTKLKNQLIGTDSAVLKISTK